MEVKHRITLLIGFLMFSSLSHSDESPDIDLGVINKANSILFNKYSIMSPPAIACYRDGRRGDPESARHAFVIAKNSEVIAKLDSFVRDRSPKTLGDFSDLYGDAFSHPMVSESKKYIRQYQESIAYCRSILKKNPDEEKAIERVIKNLEKST